MMKVMSIAANLDGDAMPSFAFPSHQLPLMLTNRGRSGMIMMVVLDGELAVPCTRNPL